MNLSPQSPVRYWAMAALLVVAAAFIHSRSAAEPLADRLPLTEFPREIAGMQSRDVPLEKEVIEILGEGEFLERSYFPGPNGPFVDFFLAYFPTQRTGSTIHSPKNCLPGAGWAPLSSQRMELTAPDGRTFHVNEYVISRGLDRQIALYWYQAHGRAVASEYWAKIYLVTDAIRMNRSDGALIRIITPVGQTEEIEQARKRVVSFAQEALPFLDRHIPR